MRRIVKDICAGSDRAVAAGQQLELIARGNREEWNLYDDAAAADKAGDSAGDPGIGPCDPRYRSLSERCCGARCVGDHALRRAGTGRESHGEAAPVKLAHRPAKNVRAGGLPKPPRHLDIE